MRDVTVRPSPGASFSIPLRRQGGVFEVMATLNSEVKVSFVVDSGASDVTIPESLAGLLINNGSLTKTDVLGSGEYKFANGHTSSGKVVRLRTLDLDGHILKDVQAVVLPGNSVPALLGQSALRQLGRWSINAKEQRLEITP
jgi:clan AA aspartic protease (TIGR02281 family)